MEAAADELDVASIRLIAKKFGHEEVQALEVWKGAVVTGSNVGNVTMFDRDCKYSRMPQARGRAVFSLVVWGEYLACGTGEGVVRLFSSRGGSGRVMGKMFSHRGEGARAVTGREGPVYCLAVWDELLASGYFDGRVRLWNIEDELVGTLDLVGERGQRSGPISRLAAWGELLVAGSYCGHLRLWNRKGECVREMLSRGAPLVGLVIWDGFLVSGGRDKIVAWNREGECVREMIGRSVQSLAVWGKFLVSGEQDGSVWLWNLRGELERELRSDSTKLPVSNLVVCDKRLVAGSSGLAIWGVPE